MSLLLSLFNFHEFVIKLVFKCGFHNKVLASRSLVYICKVERDLVNDHGLFSVFVICHHASNR